MELVLSTRNPHKLREFTTLLRGHRIVPLPEGVVLPPERATTFAGNALEKAVVAARETGSAAIADDSGIEARALGGRPGVRSARFAGEHAGDAENLAKLLAEVPATGDRRVAYVCVLAYAEPSGLTELFEARCEGTLADAPRGAGGFGYDPAFVPDDYPGERTMAELSQADKDAISHRGRAARLLLEWLERRPAGARAGAAVSEGR